MRISPTWLRDFIDPKVDDRQLAQDLTHAGIAVESVSGECNKTLYEMDITTNRVDAMNHYGVARECSAIYDLDLKPITPKLPNAVPADKPFAIEIEVPQVCPRFTARVIRGVTIGPSPKRIAERIELMGSRPISNAVDASNYVLFEIGKPTHAFDLDLLEGGKLIIRQARQGEQLRTLDGVERKLSAEDVVVADAKRAVGLAGVMGGWDTMISQKTKNILIESAWWDPIMVRKMARRHGLHTDASHRFERGADFESTVISTNLVAGLILESGGGELIGNEVDVIAHKLERLPVKLSRSELLRILGQEVPAKDVERILQRLGFTLTPDRTSAERRNDYIVDLPTWRLDVEREIDLIEEVARVYGYDNFKNTLPSFAGAVIELPEAHKDARLRSTLLALGYDEAISSTFISATDAQQFSSVTAVQLANPVSEDAPVMRTSLVPGMLDMVAHNLNRGSSDLRLFEASHVYEMVGTRTGEFKQVCIGATGNATAASIHGSVRSYSFFDLKGDLETLLAAFDHAPLSFDGKAADYYHPGRSASATMDRAIVTQFGQIHPEIAAAHKIKQEVYVAEIWLERLYRHELRVARYEPASRFPAVERDFSFIFPAAITFELISEAVAGLKLAELRSFQPVDLLQRKDAERAGIAAGKYSLLLRANFQSQERTLRDDEVTTWWSQIIKALESLGGTLRG